MNNDILIISAVISFVIAAVCGPILIPVLHRLKFGQEIREIGPSWHQKKSGTPTMGGFIFIIPILVCTLAFIRTSTATALVLFALSFGVVGFIDDYIKVVKKRNLGLTEKQKFLMQLLFSVLFICISLYWLELIDTKIFIPFAKTEIDFSWFYIPLALFVLIGTTNSVNLTDGVDGLAASVTVVVAVFFAIYAFGCQMYDIAAVNIISAASLAGFLIFNRHPAKVFMGDTGSLFLGGLVCSNALLMKNPLILIVAGGVYVIETLSVILQVASFKMTGKRIFKMSPIHHHFEMCGWSEVKIVTVASLVTMALCVVSYFASI
ncbi:MAG: phospho-N-acetylmuramoyl-pentapeptide-transferase [Ruminococcaceae bacterium]|nr:phospho-N-acetylmuramoyl-pentapeptide-transferase [Oscillospiraceae bacterium]